MSIFRGIAKLLNNSIIFKQKYSRNVIFNFTRPKQTLAPSLKLQKPQRKEPGEIYKWILLVSFIG